MLLHIIRENSGKINGDSHYVLNNWGRALSGLAGLEQNGDKKDALLKMAKELEQKTKELEQEVKILKPASD